MIQYKYCCLLRVSGSFRCYFHVNPPPPALQEAFLSNLRQRNSSSSPITTSVTQDSLHHSVRVDRVIPFMDSSHQTRTKDVSTEWSSRPNSLSWLKQQWLSFHSRTNWRSKLWDEWLQYPFSPTTLDIFIFIRRKGHVSLSNSTVHLKVINRQRAGELHRIILLEEKQ